MTDNEIIKALECCIKGDVCENCPYFTRRQRYECGEHFNKDVLDLINRQKAEIERLKNKFNEEKSENDRLSLNISNLEYDYELLHQEKAMVRVEAIKEFAERFLKKVHDNHYLLSDRINSKDYGMFTVGIEQAVNETKKEMVGEG